MGKSTYTQEIADEICERLSEGEPLRQICRDLHMPTWRTVYGWMREHEDFRTRIARARDDGYDAIAEECLDIADEPIATKEDAQRNKLRVHTRLQLLSKWSQKYGDKQNINLSGNVEIASAIVAARKRSGG